MATVEQPLIQEGIQPFRWTREEYHRLGELGFFGDKRVELVGGEILEMSPQKRAHSAAIDLVLKWLFPMFAHIGHLHVQGPVSLNDASEPEPDVAVIPGSIRDYADHPSTALLIVEVADTSLQKDREVKGSLYAAHGIADYWIVNLRERRLEVYRQPVEDPKAWHLWSYAEHFSLNPGETIRPLALSEGEIRVADLLP